MVIDSSFHECMNEGFGITDDEPNMASQTWIFMYRITNSHILFGYLGILMIPMVFGW